LRFFSSKLASDLPFPPGATGAEHGADRRHRLRRQRSLRDLLDVLPQVLEPARPTIAL
jgi:hypothetical protein